MFLFCSSFFSAYYPISSVCFGGSSLLHFPMQKWRKMFWRIAGVVRASPVRSARGDVTALMDWAIMSGVMVGGV